MKISCIINIEEKNEIFDIKEYKNKKNIYKEIFIKKTILFRAKKKLSYLKHGLDKK